MKWEVADRPAYSLLKIEMENGDSVTGEAGSMLLFKGNVDVKTTTGGGLVKALFRRMAATETVFLNTFEAGGPSEVWLVPGLPGDIEYIPLEGNSFIVQDSSYLAHHGDVTIGTAWKGLRGILAEGEMVWLKLEGRGGFWVNAYGGIEKMEIGSNEKVTIDNFHFVAMDSHTKWSVRKFGGWKSFMLGGEGLVFDVKGPAKILLQTRILPPLAKMLGKYIKTK
jgi:uncharacterized protein (TIGR00266 family)